MTESLWLSEFRANLSGWAGQGKDVDQLNEVPEGSIQRSQISPLGQDFVSFRAIHEGAEGRREQPFITCRTVPHQPEGSLGREGPLDSTAPHPPAQPDPQAHTNRGEVRRTLYPLFPTSQRASGPSSPRGKSLLDPCAADAKLASPGPGGTSLVITMIGLQGCFRRQEGRGAGAVCELVGLSSGSPSWAQKEPAPNRGPVLLFDLSEPG
jgi:hypothetical protein